MERKSEQNFCLKLIINLLYNKTILGNITGKLKFIDLERKFIISHVYKLPNIHIAFPWIKS